MVSMDDHQNPLFWTCQDIAEEWLAIHDFRHVALNDGETGHDDIPQNAQDMLDPVIWHELRHTSNTPMKGEMGGSLTAEG